MPVIDDQLLSDRDQTGSDTDQTASDRDQTVSDRDQMASDEDELSSARDQETADREQAAEEMPGDGPDAQEQARHRAAREATRHDRSLTTAWREEAGMERGRAVRTRDSTAHARDESAHLRDRVADARDHAMREQDDWSRSFVVESSDLAMVRRQAARDRARAATDRNRAAQDRKRAQRDREEAAAHRREAARERAEALRALEQAATDSLTGTRARGPGLADLHREIDRARRTTGSLVLAFVDVDGLKAVNDTHGHIAGDRLLADVGSTLREGLRSYDLITRFGGDEFVCALAGIGIDEVRQRFDALAKGLEARSDGYSFSAGFAELEDGDDPEGLIGRADHALRQAGKARR